MPSSAAADIVNDLDLLLIAPDGTLHYPFKGPGLATPTLVATTTGPNGIDTVEQIRIFGVTPGTWRIRVSGTSVPTGPQNYALVSSIGISACSAPSNDDLASAAVLPGPTATDTVDNTCASGQLGEPSHHIIPPPESPFHSVWWKWAAPVTGPVTVDTEGSSVIDTVMSVYTGTAVTSLNLVGQDDDGGTGLHSRLEFVADAGETYMIAVDGYSRTDVGDLRVNLVCEAPPNDDFAGAIALTGTSTGGSVNNSCATAEFGELAHDDSGASPGAPFHSVWWAWTAPSSGPFFVDTLGSEVNDTVLGVYTGTNVGALNLIGRNNDSPTTGLLSKVDFVAVEGNTYKIAVDGWGENDTGLTSVNISPADSGSSAGLTVLSGPCVVYDTNGAGESPFVGGGDQNGAGDWHADGSGWCSVVCACGCVVGGVPDFVC